LSLWSAPAPAARLEVRRDLQVILCEIYVASRTYHGGVQERPLGGVRGRGRPDLCFLVADDYVLLLVIE